MVGFGIHPEGGAVRKDPGAVRRGRARHRDDEVRVVLQLTVPVHQRPAHIGQQGKETTGRGQVDPAGPG